MKWNLIYRIAWIAVSIVVIAGVLSFFLPKCREYQYLQHTKLSLEQENNHLEGNIRLLETKSKRFVYDKDFVERTARELGMAKPGETLFKFNSSDEH